MIVFISPTYKYKYAFCKKAPDRPETIRAPRTTTARDDGPRRRRRPPPPSPIHPSDPIRSNPIQSYPTRARPQPAFLHEKKSVRITFTEDIQLDVGWIFNPVYTVYSYRFVFARHPRLGDPGRRGWMDADDGIERAWVRSGPCVKNGNTENESQTRRVVAPQEWATVVGLGRRGKACAKGDAPPSRVVGSRRES